MFLQLSSIEKLGSRGIALSEDCSTTAVFNFTVRGKLASDNQDEGGDVSIRPGLSTARHTDCNGKYIRLISGVSSFNLQLAAKP